MKPRRNLGNRPKIQSKEARICSIEKNYTWEEFEHGKAAIIEQFSAYKRLAGEIASGIPSNKLQSAREDFEGMFFNNMTLVLDRL